MFIVSDMILSFFTGFSHILGTARDIFHADLAKALLFIMRCHKSTSTGLIGFFLSKLSEHDAYLRFLNHIRRLII